MGGRAGLSSLRTTAVPSSSDVGKFELQHKPLPKPLLTDIRYMNTCSFIVSQLATSFWLSKTRKRLKSKSIGVRVVEPRVPLLPSYGVLGTRPTPRRLPNNLVDWFSGPSSQPTPCRPHTSPKSPSIVRLVGLAVGLSMKEIPLVSGPYR